MSVDGFLDQYWQICCFGWIAIVLLVAFAGVIFRLVAGWGVRCPHCGWFKGELVEKRRLPGTLERVDFIGWASPSGSYGQTIGQFRVDYRCRRCDHQWSVEESRRA